MKQDYIITNYQKHQETVKELQRIRVTPLWPRKKKSKKKRRADKMARKVVRRAFNKANPKMRYYTLYALLLENDYYYVGMTSYKDPMRRFQQHLDGKGAKWTKLHKPLRIIETRYLGYISESECARLETDMAIEYMTAYGHRQVRGGALCIVDYESNMRAYNKNSKVIVVNFRHASTRT